MLLAASARCGVRVAGLSKASSPMKRSLMMLAATATLAGGAAQVELLRFYSGNSPLATGAGLARCAPQA